MGKKDKLKKRSICAVLTISAFLAVFGVFYVVKSFLFLVEQSSHDKDRWGLGLPDGLECVYSKQTESFRGDGWHYYVYDLTPEDQWLEELHTGADAEVEEFYGSAVEELHIGNAYCSELRGTKYVWKRYESEDGMIRALAVYDKGRGYLYVVAFSI